MNCLWALGTSCAGNVNDRSIFAAQLLVPMCDRHYNEHLVIVSLIKRGTKQSEINKSTAEERNRMLADLTKGEDLNAILKLASEEESTKV